MTGSSTDDGRRRRRLGGWLAPLALAALLSTCAPAGARGARLLPGEPGARPVELESRSGSRIRGWLVPGRPGGGAVVLLHGIGASGADMADRARFLHAAGYSVLAIDFRGHGASGGGRSTYGGLESWDALAAVQFLRAALPSERLGVIGVSMGGAAALLGPAPLPVEALVLESVYPTIGDAVGNRLQAWLGRLGAALTPLAMRWLFPRDGVGAGELRPVDRVHEQTAPVFVIAGSADGYTPPAESRELFDRAREPRALWSVEGAGHVDLHAFAGAEYERRVGAFLARWLRGAG